MKRWIMDKPMRPALLAWLAIAVLTHALVVWSLPRLIMQHLMNNLAQSTKAAPDQAYFPDAVDARSRQVVMPSPDLLYALCRFDVSRGAMHIQVQPNWPHYWSLALYASNSDNFWVSNDRQQPRIDLWLVDKDSPDTTPTGLQRVTTPTSTGLVLLRVLTSDYATERAAVEQARRTLQCITP